MIKKLAFLIYGPESSGNHITRTFLKAMDCSIGGNSVPFGSIDGKTHLPDMLGLAHKCEKEGWSVVWVIPIRDFHCMAKSKIHRNRAKDLDAAFLQIKNEYRYIFDVILKHGGDYFLLPMNVLFEHPEYLALELQHLYDVGRYKPIKIYDADAKHRESLN